jgi:hypothetical protein
MTLPSDVEFYKDIGLLVHRPHGSLNKAAVSRIVALVGELEYSLQEPFNRFFDTVETDEVDLNFEYMIRISLYRRCVYAGRPPIKSAILATDSTITHYARLHAVLTQGSPINVRVFDNRKEAAQWLGVPIELLEPESAGGGIP